MQTDRPMILPPAAVADGRSTSSHAWILRPIIWFTAASTVTTILHELAHASVAYAVGVPSTLFSYFVDLDLTQADTGLHQRTLIGVAGPLFCLVLGVLAWVAFRRARNSGAELPLLFFTVFGIGTFFGNLASISFVGDFSWVALALNLPMWVRYALTTIGVLSVALIHFWGGRELVQWVPARAGKVSGIVGIIVLPVVVGTAAVILANQPMRGTMVTVRFAEAALWVFAAMGALSTKRHSPNGRERLAVRWADGAVLLLAIFVIRLMVYGIAFTP